MDAADWNQRHGTHVRDRRAEEWRRADHDGLVDSARGGTGNLQATLADRLEAGAETLRARARGKPDDVRIAGSRPSIASRSRARSGEASRTIADGMDRTAMWLRENDLTDLANLLQRELRERPGRVALVALGVGILVGRATRRR